MSLWLGGLVILASLGYALWRCQFGIELYDEPFYILSGIKHYALGDKPFVDEIHNGPRHYDLLNYLLARPLVGLDLLSLRRAAIGFYAFLLLTLCWVSFRKRLGLLAGMAFSACLLFDYFWLPTWSHNWWCRDFLLLHQIFLVSAIGLSDPKKRKKLYFAAGLSLGVSIVAYLPISLGVLGALLFTAWVVIRIGMGPSDRKSVLLFYILGLSLVPLCDALYILGPNVREAWLAAVRSVVSDYSSGSKISFLKIGNSLRQLFFSREGILLLISYLVLGGELARRDKPGQLRRAVFIITLLFIGKRAYDSGHLFMVAASFTACSWLGALVLFGKFLREEQLETLLLMAITIGISLAMSFVSHNSHHALFWAVPALLIPLCAEIASRSEGLSFTKLLAQRSYVLVLGLWLLVVCVGSIRYAQSTTYFDAKPAQCTATLRTAPLTGIKTTERRAYLIEKLADAVKGKQFLLSVGLPGAFYFGKTRSSTDSNILNLDFPLLLAERGLKRLQDSKRIPDLVLVEKIHSWSWGLDEKVLELDRSHPYLKFAECIRSVPVFSVPEFEIWGVDSSKVNGCLDTAPSETKIIS